MKYNKYYNSHFSMYLEIPSQVYFLCPLADKTVEPQEDATSNNLIFSLTLFPFIFHFVIDFFHVDMT